MKSPLLLRTQRRSFLALTAALTSALLSCQSRTSNPSETSSEIGSASSSTDPVVLNGAGASFPALLYYRWFSDYQTINPSVQINYQSVGSAAGIQQIMDGTVDFGASDVAMTDAEMAEVAAGVILIPMTAGSVVVAYNLPGVKSGLHLDRSTLAGIFFGEISRWNEASIAATNPDVTLPDLEIVVVYRADGSGTTATFTRHLSAISARWQEQVGAGVAVNWPVGVGAKGNEGVSAQVQLVEGVIAYVEYAYANELGLQVAALENQAGNFIPPTPEAAATTLSEIELPENLRAFQPDPVGAEAYPIVTYTWILAYANYPDLQTAMALKQALSWALSEGQASSAELGYLPLPPSVVDRALGAVEKISAS
ncbi:MAG: phosphate ABC transporter substrate-binding protein PstS [Synechococcaceae cyanobacterium SM2_3_1]|nr:phosphate ABC transporter substrate-binding protein PstS [Synechococcaceae cyanobacterium SM2_3_1]